jgi:PhnB protein
MTTKVRPVPEGYHTVCPYIVVTSGVATLIEFAKQAFGAKEVYLSKAPDGRIMHAEIKIGDSIVMVGESQEKKFPAMLHLYMEDVDGVYKRAIQAGGKSMREPADQPYGDRSAGVEDAFGNQWWIATHMEDVSSEELERRMKAAKA